MRDSLPNMRCLEKILQAKLHLPVVNERRGNTSEVGGAKRARRSAELRHVQEIERLPSKLNPVAFAGLELLEQGEVPRPIGGRVKQGNAGVAVAFGSEIN